MQYMMLIHQDFTPEDFAALPADERDAIRQAYEAIREIPGVTPGLGLQPPETATTVQVRDGRTLTTDGPFAETKEALGGYFILEADDLDSAIEIAARVPAAQRGGAVEIRPIAQW